MASNSPIATVLVVDDEEQERIALSEMISAMGYRVETAVDGEDALVKLGANDVSAIVTDLMMPRKDGFQLLRTLIEQGQLTPAIVLTGVGNMTQAVSIVHDLRAFWFLEKPAQPAALATLLERAVRYGGLLQETERLQRELSYQGMLGDMIGNSAPMKQVYALTQRVAPTQAPVLITGESGTGKEMVARMIHRLSPRAARPFVPINCAALPQDLIESELFGHEKGSFTGAVGRHLGCFEQANGGTLLLDEIGEMPLAMQARLLRALEESKIRRLGGSSEIAVDVRILAATNRVVENSVQQKALREDLYYRLNVFRIHMPALRDHPEDIPMLATAIIANLNRKHDCQVTNIDRAALEFLMAYNWPGNVRELRNVMEWALITAREGTIMPRHLPSRISLPAAAASATPAASEEGPPVALGRTLEEVEHEYILRTLESTNHDRKQAAKVLGISLRTLYNRLASINATDDSKVKTASGKES